MEHLSVLNVFPANYGSIPCMPVTSDRFVVKDHRRAQSGEYDSIVTVVRSPLDVAKSYYNFMNTYSHTR